MKEKKVSTKHRLFLEEYMNNGMNGTMAYHKIYPNAEHMTCRTGASILLSKPHIKDALEIMKYEAQQKYGIKREEIITQLKQLCRRYNNGEDNQTLLKAIDMLCKIGGFYNNGVDITSGGNKININLNLDEDK